MKRWIRTLAAELRPLCGRREMLLDGLLWLGLVGFGALESGLQDAPWWLMPIAWLVFAIAVTISRRRPLVSVSMVVALNLFHLMVTIADPQGPFPLAYLACLLVLSYRAGRRMERQRPAMILFGALAVLPVPFLLAYMMAAGTFTAVSRSVGTWTGLTVILLVAGVLPWLIGRYRRQHAELVHAGWERAEQLEREQRIIAEQAQLRERSRIAHDMHDSLGHELSLIAVRAGALEVAKGLDERHRAAVRELRESAATATGSLREIIGLLRDGSEPVPMGPSHESVTQLVDRAAASGVPVTMTHSGTHADLPPMADRAAYRVVQEGLTNATKHAPGAKVSVSIECRSAEYAVTVTNEPSEQTAGPPDAGGYGLIGLRERVRLAGGTLRSGPCPDGGFELRARLPYEGEAVDEAAESGQSALRQVYARRARRGLITAIVVPAGALAAFCAVVFAGASLIAANAVLERDDFEGLRVGQDRASVKPVLPLFQNPDAEEEHFSRKPPGTKCEYYRAKASLFAYAETYRLCFANGRLVAKEAGNPKNQGSSR